MGTTQRFKFFRCYQYSEEGAALNVLPVGVSAPAFAHGSSLDEFGVILAQSSFCSRTGPSAQDPPVEEPSLRLSIYPNPLSTGGRVCSAGS